jgi:hypothetical protein
MKHVRKKLRIVWLSALISLHALHPWSINIAIAESKKNKTALSLSKTNCKAELLTMYHLNQTSNLNSTVDNPSACQQHPWIIEIKRWQQQAVGPVEAATHLISLEEPNNDLNNLPKALRDHHMMVAAFTLAQNGWLPEARAIWENVLTRRSQWPELWLNLALSDFKIGLYDSAFRRITHIERLCEKTMCLINTDYLNTLRLAITETTQAERKQATTVPSSLNTMSTMALPQAQTFEQGAP